MRPFQSIPFCPISANTPWNAKPIPLGSDEDFNSPPNFEELILKIPKRIPAVKIFVFLELEPRLNIKYRFNGTGKIERFKKVSWIMKTKFRSCYAFPRIQAKTVTAK
jgi:hypothetical protein